MKLYVPQQIYFKFSGYSRNIKNFVLPKPKPFSNYIFDLLYISDLFFPRNQRAIFNNTLGTKYIQQIAIGNINKDCHRGLDLQYWQKAKKHK